MAGRESRRRHRGGTAKVSGGHLRQVPTVRAAADAGSNFDSANRLSLTKVRSAGGKCIAPTAVTLRSGAYPLSVRVALLARPDSASHANITEAEATLRKALSGAVPVEAAVASR